MESAATPGETSVINEVTDEEALSSGSLSNRLLIDIGVKRRFVFHQVSTAAAYFDALRGRANFQRDLQVASTRERTSTSCV